MKHLAIVGLGHSNRDYVLDASDWANPPDWAEVWTLNRGGLIFAADRIFRMDDYHLMEEKSEAEQKVNFGLNQLAMGGVRVYTSTEYPECPEWQAYPLDDMMLFYNGGRIVENLAHKGYVNSSVPYMLALAHMEGFTKVTLYGIDYSYNVVDLEGKGVAATFAEDGRSCTEYWIGVLEAGGIEVVIAKSSSLMRHDGKLYGYKEEKSYELGGG